MLIGRGRRETFLNAIEKYGLLDYTLALQQYLDIYVYIQHTRHIHTYMHICIYTVLHGEF